MTCSVDGCNRPLKALSLCSVHYTQWRRHGIGQPIRVKIRPICTIEDCERPNFGHGYCQLHYQRWRKSGDPNYTSRYFNDPVRNFWGKVEVPANAGACWLWIGAINSQGYGSFWANGRAICAHIFAYQELVGPVPDDGYEFDHVCHTLSECNAGRLCIHRRCVNPTHLERVTHHENWWRGRSPTKLNAAKTHCDGGHELTPDNLYSSQRQRVCRQCALKSSAEYRARLKLAGLIS
jgi:hypothetical protein